MPQTHKNEAANLENNNLNFENLTVAIGRIYIHMTNKNKN